MPLLLRAVRKNKWHKSLTGAPVWLTTGEIQADALVDLKTSSNTLSVWQVEDDKSNLEQVVVALAANRDTVANLDYALFNINLVSTINIKVETNLGSSPYEAANFWHRDLAELTVFKLTELAKTLFIEAEFGRFSEKEVLRLIQQAVESKYIEKSKLKEGIQLKL